MPTQTANQIKMAKLRSLRGKPKVGKPKGKKGGCAGKKSCMCGCGKKQMCGDGKKLQAVAKAARKAAELAKKAAQLAIKHRKEIAAGVGAVGTIAGQITGNTTLSSIGNVASSFGEGTQKGRGQSGGNLPVVNGTTGEKQSAYVYYPNSAAIWTGKLTF